MLRNCNRSFHCARCLLAEPRYLIGLNGAALSDVRYWAYDGLAFAPYASFLHFQASYGQTGASGVSCPLRKLMLQKIPARTVYTLARRSSLMSQFHAVKEQYKDYILLFQVGDFYELYGKDAELVTEKTTLRVTQKQGVLMAGFPVRSLDEWLKVLVEAGFQLAICNQARKEESSGSQLLHREVVQLVTPGTLLEPLTQQANFLLSVAVGPGGSLGLAWLDLSTSQFKVGTTQADKLDEDLERVAPSEVLVSKATHSILQSGPLPSHPDQEIHRQLHRSLLSECHLTPLPESWFTLEGEGERLGNSMKESAVELSTLEKNAAGAVVHFVRHTQRSLLPHISPPSHFSHSTHMAIDASSRRNLELFHPALGNTRGATLFGCLDRTVTAGGGRLLQDRLSAPLTDLQQINQRLDCVELFSRSPLLAAEVQSKLRSCADLERLVQKVAMNSASVYDLMVVRNTLLAASEGKSLLEQGTTWGESLTQELEGLRDFPDLVHELGDAIASSSVTASGYIRKGYSDEMDSLRAARRSNEGKVDQLVQRLQDASGVSKMSVVPHKTYYRVFEVSKAQTKKADQYNELVRMDTTSAKTRYTCVELQQLNAQHQQLQQMCELAEQEIFKELCQKVMSSADALLKCAGALSRLDVAISLGLLAQERGYCRPQLSDDTQMNISKGRHPVVDALQQTHFVCNDCNMNQHKLWIITGPNMGGKSTFLRQNALIIILAQMGSFVPADSALLGVTDSLFARVGASDNVVKHMSTFHLEMTEVAHILANATSKSFVILDEIGHGTSTTEGMSVANAVVEHLQHTLGCRSLLATHFHTLADFANKFPNVGAYKLVARRSSSGLEFTYQIQPGKTDYSFGVDVAELAGLPPAVVDRARALLEEGKEEPRPQSQSSTAEEAPQSNHTAAARLTTYIQSLSVDNLSPREAIDYLYRLRDIVREGK